MNDQDKLRKIHEFIKNNDLAVISTVNKDSKPEAAVVGFSEKENFELFIGTYAASRKYQNIQSNANVAIVIGWDEGKTVQYEGVIEEIKDEATLEEFKRVHLAKIPSAVKYLENPDEKFLLVKPKWIRYTDLSVDPWEVLEIRF